MFGSKPDRHFWIRFTKWPGSTVHIVLNPALDDPQRIERLDELIRQENNRLTNADKGGRL